MFDKNKEKVGRSSISMFRLIYNNVNLAAIIKLQSVI